MDEHSITAANFRRFVRETKYVTVAERPLDPADYPGAVPRLLVPGSAVFQPTLGPAHNTTRAASPPTPASPNPTAPTPAPTSPAHRSPAK